MAGRADASGPVDVDPEVTLASELRLARVQPDPDPHGAPRKTPLCLLGRGHDVVGAGERTEESVAVCGDFDPAVTGEGLAHEGAVLLDVLVVLLGHLGQLQCQV